MTKVKKHLEIDCYSPASSVLGLILTARMAQMCDLREQALDSSDPEGIHDMRVASRRLRTALRDFRPYIGKKRLAKSLKRIRYIGRKLGGVRDCDVMLTALKEITNQAPTEISAALDEFIESYQTEREDKHYELRDALEPWVIDRLRRKFERAVDAAIEGADRLAKLTRPASARADITYREVGKLTILGRLAEFEKMSVALYRPDETKGLHLMRIGAKRLRYALELFDECWSGQLSLPAKNLAGLQSSLGDLHDCDVWIREFSNTALKDSRASQRDKVASIWLINHFAKLRAKHLQKALTQWNDWESNDLSAHLQTTISHSSGQDRPKAVYQKEAY